MAKRLAMTTDGKLTFCSATEENIGKGRCNHVSHAKDGENQVDFLKRNEEIIKITEKDGKYKISDERLEDIAFLREQYENYNPELYAKSKNPYARQIAAEHGYALDKLAKDRKQDVRLAAFEAGANPELFIKDRDFDIRRKVARMGIGLEKISI